MRTSTDSLGLEVGTKFGYWFDFGDECWHSIEVLDITDGSPPRKLPRVTRPVGESPPQHVDWDEVG